MNSERFKTLTVNFRQENSAKSGFFSTFFIFYHVKNIVVLQHLNNFENRKKKDDLQSQGMFLVPDFIISQYSANIPCC